MHDDDGSLTDAIAEKCGNCHEKIILDIMKKWLQGSGEEPTWRALVEVLKDIGLLSLANEIEKALDCSTTQENPEGSKWLIDFHL